jgi:ribose transport system substrate-binding protein
MDVRRQGWSVFAAAAVAACALALAACGSSSSGSAEDSGAAAGGGQKKKALGDLSLAYASAGDSVGLFKIVGDNMVESAKELGIDLKRFDNKLDGQAALSNAGLMVQARPDVAIDWNTVVGVGQAVGNQFTKAGIPCLAVNQQIPGCAWFNLSNKKMGTDAVEIIAPEAKKRGWTGDNTTILMVIAAANGEEVNDGPRHFYVDMAKALPGFKQVGPEEITAETTTIGGRNGVQVDCKSTIEGAFAAAKNVLSSIPKQNNILLFGSDTDCTLGAYRAIKEAGRGDRTLTCGLGATPEGLEQVRTNDSWLCEGALFLPEWPRYIIAEAAAIANGVKPPKLTPAPQVMMSKDTVDKYYDGDKVIQLPPLVADNRYLADTGVLQKFGQVQGLE